MADIHLALNGAFWTLSASDPFTLTQKSAFPQFVGGRGAEGVHPPGG